MSFAALALCLHVLAAAKATDLSMPPPPPGMRPLKEAKAPKLSMPAPPPGMKLVASEAKAPGKAAPAAASDDDDAPLPIVTQDGEEDSDNASAELEEVKALEETALDPDAAPSAEVLQSLRRLGFANPLRDRMSDALEELELSEEELRVPLQPVTDLAALDVNPLKSEYDIPVEMQPLVAEYIHFFQGAGRKWFKKWMARSTRYIPVMQPILEQHGCPKDLVYLAMIESGFSAQAYSWAHASGPWQFIASTGKQYGLKQDFWIDERRDPVKATVAAARYLKQLYTDLGHWYLAWAGYNAGAGRVHHVINQKSTTDFWALSEGKGLAKETRHYVPKLIAAALVAKHPDAFGFAKGEIDFEPIMAFDEVKVASPTDLEVLARAAGTDVKSLQELNPELKRWCTPPMPAGKSYSLRVPKGLGPVFTANFAKVPAQERLTFKSYLVKRGDTLSKIAQSFGSASEAIMRLNGLKSARYLKVNMALMIPVPSAKGNGREVAVQNQAARARRAGFVAVRPDEEIPAGSQQKAASSSALAGTVKTAKVDGKLKVTYGVAGGDSLWTIAQRFNCTVEELRDWNALPKQKHGLKVGQLLTVWPGPSAGPIADSPSAGHTEASTASAAFR